MREIRNTRKERKLDYPFYCPHCDENLYRFEAIHKRELKQKQTRNDTSEGVVRLYSHDIAWWLDDAGHELNETDEEQNCRMLEQNCYAGELCSTTTDGREVYGWWNIKKQ